MNLAKAGPIAGRRLDAQLALTAGAGFECVEDRAGEGPGGLRGLIGERLSQVASTLPGVGKGRASVEETGVAVVEESGEGRLEIRMEFDPRICGCARQGQNAGGSSAGSECPFWGSGQATLRQCRHLDITDYHTGATVSFEKRMMIASIICC
jgi:hypothetical protein